MSYRTRPNRNLRNDAGTPCPTTTYRVIFGFSPKPVLLAPAIPWRTPMERMSAMESTSMVEICGTNRIKCGECFSNRAASFLHSRRWGSVPHSSDVSFLKGGIQKGRRVSATLVTLSSFFSGAVRNRGLAVQAHLATPGINWLVCFSALGLSTIMLQSFLFRENDTSLNFRTKPLQFVV